MFAGLPAGRLTGDRTVATFAAMDVRIALLPALLLAAAPAGAQPIPRTAPTVDCRAMSAQSQGRMTVAQCEQQFGAYAGMIDAMNQPGGERPGDERLTCPQIESELRATPAQGVSRENAAEGVAAAEDYKARMARLQAEAAAASAAQTGVNVAAAAVPGNAASGAAMASQRAMQDSISAKARAEIDPAVARMQAANAASMGDVTRMLRSNPRLARLIQLAAAKNCQIQ
jgi:hypothetical protein